MKPIRDLTSIEIEELFPIESEREDPSYKPRAQALEERPFTRALGAHCTRSKMDRETCVVHATAPRRAITKHSVKKPKQAKKGSKSAGRGGRPLRSKPVVERPVKMGAGARG